MKTDEILKRYAEGERDFQRKNLLGVNLPEANLSNAFLYGAVLPDEVFDSAV
jgi:uncharacterized protein YjbI with pentapeptide repeats